MRPVDGGLGWPGGAGRRIMAAADALLTPGASHGPREHRAMTVPAPPIAVALGLHQQGRLDQAEDMYRGILAAEPLHADALHLLGVAAHQRGRHREALDLIRRAIAADPCQATFLNSLGAVHQAIGDLPAAADAYRSSIALDMDSAVVLANLGLVLRKLGQHAAAAAALRRASLLSPGDPRLLNSLGISLRAVGGIAESADCFRGVLEIREDFWEAHSNLGNTLKDQCRFNEAIVHYRRAIELAPQVPHIRSNMLCALHYRDGIGPAELAAAHDEFEEAYGRPLRDSWRPHDNDPDPDRPLRIGFLSPDLHRHPVGNFLVGVLEQMDSAEAESFCYSTSSTPDDLTARLRARSSWRDVRPLTEGAIAERIRADAIDILFDLAGHTGNNRILVMARRPAPIQVSWAGYVGTTGLSAIDYLLADRHEIPPHLERHYRERILLMPDSYVCYEPPTAIPVAPLPALDRGHVTFGSFSNPAKLGPQVAGPWSRILERVPGSRLLLKYNGLGDAVHTARIAAMFAERGVDRDRLVFEGHSPQSALFHRYGDVDVALDPFPYGGGVTTLEALWMGVPVVTCPGATFAGRHALTHLSAVGLTETIARDLDHYVDTAVSLAEDLPALADLRAGLRDRMAASPVCDVKRFTADFLAVLRGAWREWAAGRAAAVD
ncbi:MAG: tetratricopeptide repeat protein [Planctomycetia bacterium]|nr:tetratricopeptide repeat protein [Planctomycetia bacterium]